MKWYQKGNYLQSMYYEVDTDVQEANHENREVKQRLRPSVEDPSELELNWLLDHLEYTLGEEAKLPVFILSNLSKEQKLGCWQC